MKQFDYNKYLKNNPLLKEENKSTRQTTGDEDADWMGEDFNPSKNPFMKTASDLYDTLLTNKKYQRKLDDYLVDDIIEDIIGKPFDYWESLSDRELKKVIPFLQAVIKWIDSKKEFIGLDMGWDGKQLTSTDDTEDMDEGFNPLRKMKDFAGEKGWTFSARRPTDEEDQIGREYMESQGKKLGSIGVDRITGNINVMEPNGDFRAILSPDGEELSAYEMDIHEADKEEKSTTSSNPNAAKIEKFMNDNKTFIDKIKLFVGNNPKLLASLVSSINQKISTDKKIRQTSDAQQAGKYLKRASGEKPIQALKSKEDINESKKRKK